MKTKRITKFFALLLCCMLLLGLGSASVSAAQTIDTVSVNGLMLPAKGQAPDFSVAVPENADYTLGMHAELGTVANVFWYEMIGEDIGQMLLEDDIFEKGKIYRMEVFVHAKEGYAFDSDAVKATLNGNFDLSVSQGAFPSENQIGFYYDFYVGDINEVFVSDLTLPIAGQTPDYEVSVPQDALYHVENNVGSDSWINGMLWVDEKTDQPLGKNDTFVKGQSYRVYIDLAANTENLSFSSPTLGFINGELAEVYYPWGVRLEMSYTAQEEINSVFVDDIDLPVGGNTPDYDASVPADAGYYVENMDGDGWTNGMLWVDVATDQVLKPTDTFVAGRAYQLLIGVQSKEDYKFPEYVTAAVNGETATVYYPVYGIRLEMIYTALPADDRKVLNVAAITGLTLPATGETPDYEVGVPNGAGYYVDNVEGDGWTNGMLWVDVKADKVMSATDQFVAGREYQVLIGVMPKEGYKFAQEVLGTINDEEADVYYPSFGLRLVKNYVAEKADAPAINPFDDVNEADYFYDPVLWAVEEGITNGVDENSFGPDEKCTRAQAVTFLWRAAGEPAPKSATHPFTDVVKGIYYEKAVIWAVEKGITAGTSATTFSPDEPCTRGQIVTFLWRFENKPASSYLEMPFVDVIPGFYYEDAVLWAVEKNITKGTSATTFEPDAKCTRGQIVTFLYRDIVL